jgi:hypothetical protein
MPLEKTREERGLDRAFIRMISASAQNAYKLQAAEHKHYSKELAEKLSPAELAEHEAEVKFYMQQWYANQRSLDNDNHDELPAVEVENIIDEIPAVELIRGDNELPAEEVIRIVESELHQGGSYGVGREYKRRSVSGTRH